MIRLKAGNNKLIPFKSETIVSRTASRFTDLLIFCQFYIDYINIFTFTIKFKAHRYNFFNILFLCSLIFLAKSMAFNPIFICLYFE